VSRYRTNTKKPINKKKKYREGGPVGEPVMLDEVDFVAPKFLSSSLKDCSKVYVSALLVTYIPLAIITVQEDP
jgi:hypothetical protein